MSLTSSVKPVFTAEYSRAKGYGLAAYSLGQHPIFSAINIAFIDGTGVGAADLLYVTNPLALPSLAASAFVDLDLSGLTDDAIGDDIVMAKVKVLAVYADPLNQHDLTIGGAALNTFVGPFGAATHQQSVRAGGLYLAVTPGDGWLVTPGTGDLFRIANAGAVSAVTYHVLIIGATA